MCVHLYYSFMEQESDRKVKAIWELHLNMELEHLHAACELMRKHDGRDPAEVLAPELLDTGFVGEAHERFQKMQDALMGR